MKPSFQFAKQYLFLGLLFGLILPQANLWGQVTIEINRLPIGTPDEPELFLTASFNGWKTDEEQYKFKFHHSGTYRLTLHDATPPFEYKITRGDWETSEADLNGNPTPNRVLDRFPADGFVRIDIEGWVGEPQATPIDSARIVVTSIPENTPEDARIYVAGTFNSWQTGLENFQLKPQGDGSYSITVPIYRDTVEYKFTRGSWSAVEGRKSGRARFNRRFIRQDIRQKPVRVEILSWEDLSGTPMNPYTVFWLMAAIQGMLIFIAINTLENNNIPANRRLSVLLVIIAVALIGRVVVYDRDIFNLAPKLILVPDLIYFLYAPIFLQYIDRLLRHDPEHPNRREWLHFLPFLIHVLAYMPLFLLSPDDFINRAINLELRPIFVLTGGLALIYNLIYFFWAKRLVQAYVYDTDHTYSGGSNVTFLQTILLLKGICLFLWASAYLIGIYGVVSHTDVTFITDRGTDAIWIGFSLTAFLLGYFAMKEPEIFKLPQATVFAPPTPPLTEKPLPKAATIEQAETEPEEEDFTKIKEKLTQLMESRKPYLNPKLTLPDLADLAGETLHDLSKAINQGFGMNFNDYVNSFRVKAFKEQVLLPEYQNHTFLAVALMVGFNSKTAFNRSFKKLTGQTPREYFHEAQEKSTSSQA